MNNISNYAKWESAFNACRTRQDYWQYYISHISNEDNPFRDKALEKVELFNSYKKELDECNSVEDIERYVLKYIDSDNEYLPEAKTRIAELSKYNTSRWGVYRLLCGILCFLLAIGCLFIVLAIEGTSNSILALIGLISMGGILLFTCGGIWLIYQGIIILKNNLSYEH